MVDELWKSGRFDDAKKAFDGGMQSEYEYSTSGKNERYRMRGLHFFVIPFSR